MLCWNRLKVVISRINKKAKMFVLRSSEIRNCAKEVCVCVNLDTNLRNKGVPIRIRVSMRKVCVSFIISDEIFLKKSRNVRVKWQVLRKK